MNFRTTNINKDDLISAGVTKVEYTKHHTIAVYKGEKRVKSTGLWISIWNAKEKIYYLLFLEQVYAIWHDNYEI